MYKNMVDSHCHLNLLTNYNDIIYKCSHMILHNICVEKNDFKKIDFFTKKYPNVYGTYGIHPNYVFEENQEDYSEETIKKYLNQEKIIAIGETGIDLFRDHKNINYQIISFENHIKVSIATGKPLIIHCRSSKDTDNAAHIIEYILEKNSFKDNAIIHCFDGSDRLLNLALKLNLYISISGLCTYSFAKLLQNNITKIPLHKLLIETDSPYLMPSNIVNPINKENNPANLYYIAKQIAKILNKDIEEIFNITYLNYQNLYKNFL